MSIKDNILYLLESEEISNYQISKATGIAQTTLSRFARKESDIGNMSLDNALKLNDYYCNLNSSNGIDNEKMPAARRRNNS
ncbi:MAG TPA: hypothetical protein VK108_10045 [Pseudogracilibacillus sp.]|nr:hypothetical protein [Pseudogracilibacillus sp.]